jgi:hypothetical protein
LDFTKWGLVDEGNLHCLVVALLSAPDDLEDGTPFIDLCIISLVESNLDSEFDASGHSSEESDSIDDSSEVSSEDSDSSESKILHFFFSSSALSDLNR